MNRYMPCILIALTLAAAPWPMMTVVAQQSTPQVDRSADLKRLAESQSFHIRSMQTTGLLIPLYRYPDNVFTNETFNRVIAAKRQFETIPFWVILNPASGPGKSIDANYVKAVDRLRGAGCVVLGYVSTEYGKRNETDVKSDVSRWIEYYPRIHGVFFDEMLYEDTEKAVDLQKDYQQFAYSRGLWPAVANPGAPTPERFFAKNVADVIVVHEGDQWPSEKSIHGNYFGGYADYPPFGRCVLVHSVKGLDPMKLAMVRKYARWIYVTDDEYELNDPSKPNPWDELSTLLIPLCEAIDKRSDAGK